MDVPSFKGNFVRFRCLAVVSSFCIFISGCLFISGCSRPVAEGADACDPDQVDDCPSGFGCYPTPDDNCEFRCFRTPPPDVSSCYSCGNGYLEPGEVCDDGNQAGGDGCSADCLSEEICGNGIADVAVGEACDGDDFGSDSCQAHGFHTGSLDCSADCLVIDDSGCTESCGDGICQPVHGESPSGCPDDCTEYMDISAGYLHACAVTADRTVACWGYGTDGQLGNGSNESQTTPVHVAGLVNTVAVSGGYVHTSALMSDGTAWSWGNGVVGQLGNGATEDSSTVVPVTGMTNAVAVSAGDHHTCALASDGTVWCWGLGTHGQLGNGSTEDSSTLVQVTGLTNAVAIAGGGVHSCAVKSDGTAWCWGHGYDGRLGNGLTPAVQSTPVQVTGLTNAVTISCGESHTCALAADGRAWCWGFGYNGQLGNGLSWDSPIPVRVAGLTNVVAISAGFRHNCAIVSDGTAWCWGAGYYGQLGNGSYEEDSSTAVQVTGLADVAAVSAGGDYTCALDSSGTAWCWGSGGMGHLGNGSTEDATTPVPVAPLP